MHWVAEDVDILDAVEADRAGAAKHDPGVDADGLVCEEEREPFVVEDGPHQNQCAQQVEDARELATRETHSAERAVARARQGRQQLHEPADQNKHDRSEHAAQRQVPERLRRQCLP